jgi:hypothetical protein
MLQRFQNPCSFLRHNTGVRGLLRVIRIAGLVPTPAVPPEPLTGPSAWRVGAGLPSLDHHGTAAVTSVGPGNRRDRHRHVTVTATQAAGAPSRRHTRTRSARTQARRRVPAAVTDMPSEQPE